MNTSTGYQTHVEQLQTRWGEVRHLRERLDDTYTRHTYQGPKSAVIERVGARLAAVTPMYEHMFMVESVSAIPNGRIEVVCMQSNYAGD